MALAQVVTPEIKAHKITCPYCIAGWAWVTEVHRGRETQIEGIHDPRKCEKCGKFFKLKTRVQVYGVKLEA